MSPVDSLRTETKFKKTEIGDIPVDWEVVSTLDIIKKGPRAIKIGPFGSQLKKEYFVQSGYKVYGQENVFKNDFMLGNRRLDKRRFEMLSSFQLHPGDVVITMMGTIGMCAIVPESIEPGIMDSHLLRLKVDENQYSKKLLVQLISNSSIIKKQIKQLSVGSIMEGLSSNIIKKLIFPSPPTHEQRKIAEILSAADEAIEKKHEIIEKTKELKKGLMQELLTRGIGHTKFKKTEIGEIPEDWQLTKLGNFAMVRYGIGQPPEIAGEGVPMIRATNIKEGKIIPYGLIYVKNNKFPSSKEPYLKEGNLLVVRSGAYTGDIGLITKRWEGAIAGYDLIVTPSYELNSLFLSFYLLSPYVQKKYFVSLKDRSAQPHLNAKQIEMTPLALPSLSEQEIIASVLEGLDQKVELEISRVENLETIKAGLMQILLTGRLRVRF